MKKYNILEPVNKDTIDFVTIDLFKATIQDHKDLEHPFYNSCEKDPCVMCERAKEIVSILEEKHNTVDTYNGICISDMNN